MLAFIVDNYHFVIILGEWIQSIQAGWILVGNKYPGWSNGMGRKYTGDQNA